MVSLIDVGGGSSDQQAFFALGFDLRLQRGSSPYDIQSNLYNKILDKFRKFSLQSEFL